MHFLNLLPALLMLAGVNAGVLEDHGYTIRKYTDSTCTITTYYYDEGDQPVNEFKVDKTNKVITIRRALNGLEAEHYNQLSLPEILEAVCSEYDLVPDSIDSVVMEADKNHQLRGALEHYRYYHSVPDNEYVTVSITSAMPAEWERFTMFWLYADVANMLTSSRVNKIHVQEKDESCLLTYFIDE